MGWNFRKSIRLAPGLRINLGKRGASVTVGKRGLTTTFGSSGTRTTVGLPGTGISYTFRGNGNSGSNNSAGAPNQTTNGKLKFSPGVLLLLALIVLAALALGH